MSKSVSKGSTATVLMLLLVSVGSVRPQPSQRFAESAESIEPPWLEERRQAQLATRSTFDVFHNFSFVDRLEDSGIDFSHGIVEDSGKFHIPVHYDHGNGIAVADVDGDQRLDIYLLTQAGGNQLWRNKGGGKFENITSRALGLDDRISVAASFGDIDNDGDPDLYVTAVRSGNRLFENDGTGKFTDISVSSGLDYRGHSSAGVFFDYDRDGLLDLFLTNVGTYTTDTVTTVSADPLAEQTGQEYQYYVGYKDAFSGHLKPERAEGSILFRNQGNNRFVDVSAQTGLVDSSWSGDASPLDFNGDAWLDLYVLNMQGHDSYYENVEGRYFVDKSRQVFPRTPWGSMGIKVFDYDNDGLLDIYITDMHSDMSQDVGPEQEKLKASMLYPEEFLRSNGASIFGNAFFRNEGGGRFSEISDGIGAENYWPWGVSVGDLNADGYQDVFISASMNYPYRYGVNSILLNNRGKEFLDSEFVLGVEPRRGDRTAKPWFELDCMGSDRRHPRCATQSDEMRPGKRRDNVVVWGTLGSRSSVVFDLDRDGDLDIVTNDFNSEPMVLVSDLSAKKELRFVKIELVGRVSNRNGLGAKVVVRANSSTYTKVYDGKSGYLSQSLIPLYFGLGAAESIDQIEVYWPSGIKQLVSGPLATNQYLKVVEP